MKLFLYHQQKIKIVNQNKRVQVEFSNIVPDRAGDLVSQRSHMAVHRLR